MSEAQVTAKTQTADFALWVDQYGDYLFKYAVFRLRDSVAAEDLVQETFLAALKGYERFQGRGSERTWLVGIIKHKITDHFRKITRETPLGQTEEDYGPEHVEFFTRTDGWDKHWNNDYAPTDWHATPDKLVEQTEFWRIFHDCLGPLPQRTATAFTFREVDGLKTDEICEMLGVTTNNLWVMLHRARLHLRNCLEMKWFKQVSEKDK